MGYDKRPIGVFDSGVGGISVLAELAGVLPNEDFLYYGDSKNAPYGTKSAQEVLELSESCTKKLIDMDAKAIVIACNTATSAAAEYLREKYSTIPIIGIEPAIKPASEFKKNSKILVMATPMTLEKEKFKNLAQSFCDDEIIALPCPGLVELIEQGKTEGSEVEEFLRDRLAPCFDRKIDSVVLGCTHYPFVKDTIKAVFPYHVEIFDGGFGAACQTKRRLKELSLSADESRKGEVRFLNSSENSEMIELCKKLFWGYSKSV